MDTIAVLVEFLQDAVNAICAAKPIGSFATAQRLIGGDGPSASVGDASAAGVAATNPSASAGDLEAAAALEAADAAELEAAANFGGFK